MNWRVGFNLILAVVWLGLGLYLLLRENERLGCADSHFMGWLALLLMLWNILRAGLSWSKPKRNHEHPF